MLSWWVSRINLVLLLKAVAKKSKLNTRISMLEMHSAHRLKVLSYCLL